MPTFSLQGQRGHDLQVYFRLLAAVAAGDGHIHQDEIEKLSSLVELAGGDPLDVPRLCHEAERSVDAPFWFLRDLDTLPKRDFLQRATRDAFLFATVGSTNNRASMRIVQQAADHFGQGRYLQKLKENHRARRRIPHAEKLRRKTIDAVDQLLDRADGTAFDRGDDFNGRVYFRLLAAIAAADGAIQDPEVVMIAELMSLSNLRDDLAFDVCDVAMAKRVEPLWFLADTAELTPAFARVCIRDANILALASDGLSDAEAALLKRAARKLGVREFDIVMTNPQDEQTKVVRVTLDPEGQTITQEDEIQLALGYTSGVTLATTGAYILAGGNLSTVSTFFLGAAGVGVGAWVVPAALLLGGGVARTLALAWSDHATIDD